MTTPPLHWSDLSKMQKSPAHYRHHMDSKGKPGHGEATAAMRFGSLVNDRLLGTTAYGTEFVVWEGGRRQGKAWDAFSEEHAGQEIVTVDESSMADAASAAVRFHPVAGPLIQSGAIEKRINWEFNGRACSGTPDVLGPTALVDLKVTGDANPDRFMWHAIRMGWFGQLGWYRDGAIRSGLPDPKRCHIIAVEAKPPHVVTVFDLTDAAIEFGRCQWRALFERLMTCEASNQWPGYCATSTALDAPDTDSFLLNINGEDTEVA